MRTENPEKLNIENKNLRSYMVDMIIMLFIIAVVAVYTYGARAIETILLSVISAVAAEALCCFVFMRKKPERLLDLSAVFTGLVIALALPSAAPLWLAPVGSVFAICIAKLPFGNANTTPFVPAAAGIAFLTVTYPNIIYTYPSLSIGSLENSVYSADFVSGTSLAQMLSQSKSIGTNILNVLDVLVGRIPGPMGASCLILMVGTFIYMLIRKHPGCITTASFLAVCSFMSVLFPRVLTGRTYSLLMEMSAGLLFYAAVFFISDPVTSPKNQLGKVLYGVFAGILTMLFRYFGAFEEGVCFVILIMNALSDVIDKLGIKLANAVQQKNSAKAPRERRRAKRSLVSTSETDSDEGGILDNEDE